MSELATSHDEATRPVPLVICVPPPKAGRIGVRVIFYAVAACVYLVPALAVGGWWWAALLAWTAGFVSTAWFVGRRSAAFNRRRTAFLERHEHWEGDPVAAALDRNWYVLSRPPPLEEVKRILRREGMAPGERAVIVCMAALDPPDSGDMRFEPEVIKHKRPDAPARLRHWWLVLLVVLTAALLGSYIFPRVSRPEYVVWGLIALLAFGVWFWRYAVRTSYLRLAPGMIQLLEFRPFSREPAIRSYPMTADTLVVLAENVHALTLTMSRAAQADTIPIDKGEHFDATMERLWAALLSTAPTPPLSDEELVG